MRQSFRICMKSLLLVLFVSLPAHGGITYVDATTGNTTLANGSAYSPTATRIDNDNEWSARTFGNNANVYTANDNNAIPGEDAPRLRTTITGLVPGQSYAVYVYFWGAGTSTNAEWDIQAGVSESSMTVFSRTNATSLGDGYVDDGTVTNSTAFTTPVMVEEGNRDLLQASLGNLVADETGAIRVFIDDLPGNDDRTWYDGLGYGPPATEPPLASSLFVEVAPNGTWTWFNDERAIFHQGSFFCGYVKSNGQYGVTRYNPADGSTTHMILSTTVSQQIDDHNNPSLTVLPDGRLLAVYSKHSAQSQLYHRTSLVDDPASDSDWGGEVTQATPAATSYANTYRLSAEGDRIYNFHRCINYNPTLTRSSNLGATWDTPIQLIQTGTGSVRPYPRYCSNHSDRIDVLYTDGHPRNQNNSIYHLFYQGGNLWRSDGTLIDTLANAPIDHDAGERGSVVYPYSDSAWGAGQGPDDWIPSGRAWTWDIHYGTDGNPVCAFQVQVGTDATWSTSRIYYYYARWTGTGWQRRFIAQGGRGLYAAESDYGGGMAIDPVHPNVVYISTNAASPFALADIQNVPLSAGSRYEIWRGVTLDGGLTFTWEPVTQNSDANNIRPIVPENHGYDRAVVWNRGTYNTYTSFSTKVVALFENDLRVVSMNSNVPTVSLAWKSSPGRYYRITASEDLADFGMVAAENIPSGGASTSLSFDVPAALSGKPRAFFRIEEQ
jgi:hypothetical protein